MRPRSSTNFSYLIIFCDSLKIEICILHITTIPTFNRVMLLLLEKYSNLKHDLSVLLQNQNLLTPIVTNASETYHEI